MLQRVRASAAKASWKVSKDLQKCSTRSSLRAPVAVHAWVDLRVTAGASASKVGLSDFDGGVVGSVEGDAFACGGAGRCARGFLAAVVRTDGAVSLRETALGAAVMAGVRAAAVLGEARAFWGVVRGADPDGGASEEEKSLQAISTLAATA